MKAVRVVVFGVVQGVGFRANAAHRAHALRLAGWVRNQRDGALEAFAQGSDRDVDAFVEWCRQGPRLARVTGVQVSEAGPEPQLVGFQVRATE
jgi:acylphosphatase